MSHANLYPVGLPGIPPANFRYQRLWYTVVTIGQLLHRLVRPYQRLPLQTARLVDDNQSIDSRVQLADQMLALPECCVDRLFAQPFLQSLREEGGSIALDGGTILSDLECSLRVKVSNLEIELNFSRAATTRHAMHGKSHKVASMVSKHITAEVKLGQRRKMIALLKSGKRKKATNPGRVTI